MADIFISKSTKDDALALSIFDVLERNGIDCWIQNRDLPEETPVGTEYANQIVRAIRSSKAVLLLLSANSNVSRHVLNEVSTACDSGIKVFVVQIEEVSPNETLQYYLSQEQWIVDESIAETGNYEKIVRTLFKYTRGDDVDAKRFVDEEYIKKTNFKKLVKDTKEKRQSFSLSMAIGKEEEYDNNHFYEKIVRLDVVDSQKNYWSSYRLLTVRNVTDEYTNHLIHKECGEDKANFKDMRIKARIFENGEMTEKLTVESMTTIQPNLEQLFKINFKTPLEPGGTLSVFYRLDWPNEPSSYYKEELSQSISLTRYRKGVGSLVFGVYEPTKVLSTHIKKVSEMNEHIASEGKCNMMAIDEEPLLEGLHGKPYFGMEYSIDNPDGILYQILYKIESKPEENDEDDDFF